MPRECVGCCRAIEEQMAPSCEYCFQCHQKRLEIDWLETKDDPEVAYQFRGWKVTAFAGRSLFDRHANWVFIEGHLGDKTIEVSLKKREGSDDEFIVVIGDKQLVVKATDYPESRAGQGRIQSSHDHLEWIDGPEE